MPTYDYKCNACPHRFEEFQSMKDKPLRKCPACGKAALERLIGTGAALIFKGSGFYQTDYRTESYKKGAQAESPSAASSDAGTSAPVVAPSENAKAGAADAPPPPSPAPAAAPQSAPAKATKRKSKSD